MFAGVVANAAGLERDQVLTRNTAPLDERSPFRHRHIDRTRIGIINVAAIKQVERGIEAQRARVQNFGTRVENQTAIRLKSSLAIQDKQNDVVAERRRA